MPSSWIRTSSTKDGLTCPPKRRIFLKPLENLISLLEFRNQLSSSYIEIGERQPKPLPGLKSFESATIAISGIELAEQIKKGQFNTGKLGGSAATMPEICQVALAA